MFLRLFVEDPTDQRKVEQSGPVIPLTRTVSARTSERVLWAVRM